MVNRGDSFPMMDCRRRTHFTLATMVTASLLVAAGIPSASAGTSNDPEIIDAGRDVSPAVFATNATSGQALFANASAYDIVRSWIGPESANDFLLFIQVRDLPDAWGPAGQPPAFSPFGPNASFAGTSLVANFTIGAHTYWAIAKLAYLGDGARLMDNYTLWRGGKEWIPLSGAYNVSEDLVQMRIPKAAMDGLTDQSRLQSFYVIGRFGNHSMDFAPDAKDPNLLGASDPGHVSRQVANGRFVTPQYGREYQFGQYYQNGDQHNFGSASDLLVRIEGPSTKMIPPGQTAHYDVLVQNRAPTADTVYFTLNSVSSGWNHEFERTQLRLEPGEARLLSLRVTSAAGTTGSLRSFVDASSVLGASHSVFVDTVLQPAASSSQSHDPQAPILPSPTSGADTPNLGVGAVAVLLSLVALATRRGRR